VKHPLRIFVSYIQAHCKKNMKSTSVIKVATIKSMNHAMPINYHLKNFTSLSIIFNSLHSNMNLIQNSQAVKKECRPQECCCEKRFGIQSGGQEMAVMVG